MGATLTGIGSIALTKAVISAILKGGDEAVIALLVASSIVILTIITLFILGYGLGVFAILLIIVPIVWFVFQSE